MTQDKIKRKPAVVYSLVLLPFGGNARIDVIPSGGGIMCNEVNLDSFALCDGGRTAKKISLVHRPRSITIKIERLKNK
jgi:hypothetical protein